MTYRYDKLVKLLSYGLLNLYIILQITINNYTYKLYKTNNLTYALDTYWCTLYIVFNIRKYVIYYHINMTLWSLVSDHRIVLTVNVTSLNY